jgi:sterol desaturase/sphingolipid hydroxylase (fatty acid hydroxylase superfamily)
MAQGKRSHSTNFSEPLWTQIGEPEHDYWSWVHHGITPVEAKAANASLIERGDQVAARWPSSVRMFRSRWLERLSHIPWWLIPLVWVPIVTTLFAGAVAWRGASWSTAVGWTFGGFVLWTLAEYLLHRFVFHYRPRSAFGYRLHFIAHGVHHLDPWDRTRLVFPPLGGLILASAIFGMFCLALPSSLAMATMSGFLAGYIVYDMTHYHTHHGRPRSRWGKFLRAWHMSHHHRYPHQMYGVSQPVWDFVFRTWRPTSR